jgi:hypothetical protein
VIRREKTLNRVMSIVINEPAKEKAPDVFMYPNPGIQGAGISLQQYGTLSQRAQQAQLAAQHARNYAQGYTDTRNAQGYTDTRSLYNGVIDPRL